MGQQDVLDALKKHELLSVKEISEITGYNVSGTSRVCRELMAERNPIITRVMVKELIGRRRVKISKYQLKHGKRKQ